MSAPRWMAASLAGALCLWIVPYGAAETVYTAHLEELNNSGVTGQATITLNGNSLTVHVVASGLEANQIHPQHIHGLPGDTDSLCPTLEQDDDGDGFVELLEGADTYGPVILNLTSPPTQHGHGADLSGFPTADADGDINFTETYTFDPGDSEQAAILEELLPLEDRHVVIHGLTVAEGVGIDAPGVDDEVNGLGGYKAILPVACGEIELATVPEPASAGLLLGGSLLLLLRRHRRRAVSATV